MDDIFHRTAYAQDIARDLLRPGPLTVGLRSGVFLSGMRRVGKTTFLRQDLMPALQAEGALTVYVDLWADKLRAPSVLVREAVQRTVKDLESPASPLLAALRRVQGLDIGIGPFKFGLKVDNPRALDQATLAEAFAELVRSVGTDVVLIVDEVQHALGTEDGVNLLHGLKAARDRVNTAPDLPGQFIFLGTGSHKSLVTDMATRRSHPFAGATAVAFRLLDDDFVHWRLTQIGAAEPRAVLPSTAVAVQGFRQMGNRPEEFGKALVDLQRQMQNATSALTAAAPRVRASRPAARADALFNSICQTRALAAADVEIAAVEGLGQLARAIFARIAQGRSSGLFGSDALAEYARACGVAVDVPQVQNTADKMIAGNLIQRVGHGLYEVADPFVREAWLAHEQPYRLLAAAGPQDAA